MGSGSNNLYSSNSGSQPYAYSYHVVDDMKQYDIDNGTYKGKYKKNPTAMKLTDAINGNYIVNKSFNGDAFTYVVDLDDNIIFGKRNGNGPKPAEGTPHPTLIGGKDPVVKMAGILKIRNGKIYSYDDRSGHFRPNSKSMHVADEAFSKLPKELFHKEFKKGREK